MRKSLFIALIIPLLFIRCGKGGADDPNPQPVINPPVGALLTFPQQNSVCTTGTGVGNNQSSITFTWSAYTGATSYDLVLKNLLTTASTTQSTTDVKLTLALNMGTPYSWYIVSKTASGNIQSDTWKFYMSGPGVVTIAPFPADLTSPTVGQTVNAGTVNLTWTGSVPVTFTIANYDVYFGTSATPPLYKANVTDSFVNNVPAVTKTTYYWKVVTRDTNGNTSYSQVSQFTVN